MARSKVCLLVTPSQKRTLTRAATGRGKTIRTAVMLPAGVAVAGGAGAACACSSASAGKKKKPARKKKATTRRPRRDAMGRFLPKKAKRRVKKRRR